tara:strand:+ start:25602 stop:26057 length:456 start_codon:yes stop_codon:yes gene_type:complete
MNMTPASAPHCPVCDGAEQVFEMAARGHDLYRCGGCATIYVHGLPSNAEVAAGYDDSYDGATTGYFAKVDKKMRRSRGRIRQLKKLVPTGGRFLDVGCNGGFVVDAAREAGLDAWGWRSTASPSPMPATIIPRTTISWAWSRISNRIRGSI